MRALIYPTAIAVMFLVACSKADTDKTTSPPSTKVEIVQPPKPPFDGAMWKAAFRATFEESKLQTSDDGTAEYVACFEDGRNTKCDLFFFGKRDGFRKIDHLVPAHSQLNNIVKMFSNVKTYIAARECKMANILIEPIFTRKGSWIFLEKIAFMVDGDVTFEKSFDNTNVDREQDYPRIIEKSTFILDEKDMDGLKKFVSGKNQIIRFTGQKGYFTLEKDRTEEFRKDIDINLKAVAKINGSLKEVGGPSCS